MSTSEISNVTVPSNFKQVQLDDCEVYLFSSSGNVLERIKYKHSPKDMIRFEVTMSNSCLFTLYSYTFCFFISIDAVGLGIDLNSPSLWTPMCKAAVLFYFFLYVIIYMLFSFVQRNCRVSYKNP